MTLVLKSDNVYRGEELPVAGYAEYLARVEADGGEVMYGSDVEATLLFIQDQGLTAKECFSVTSAKWGIKKEAGKVSKLYSLFGEEGDVIAPSKEPELVGTGMESGIQFQGLTPYNLTSVGDFNNLTDVSLHATYTAPSSTDKVIVSVANRFNKNTRDDPEVILLRLGAAANNYNAMYNGNTIRTTATRSDTGGKTASSAVLADGSLDILAGGQKVATTPAIDTEVVSGTFLLLGGSTMFTKMNAFDGVLNEAWCILGASDEQRKAINVRLTP